MADRLTELVLGLQRLAENAKLRGDDLRYTQQQETQEHIDWLDHLLHMVEEVRGVFLNERKRFMPIERERPPLMPHQEDAAKMPRIVKQGPKADAG
jgi:hypothetical protein